MASAPSACPSTGMLSILVIVGFLCTATAIAEVMEVTQPAIVLANRQGVASLVCKYKNIGNAQEIRVTLLKQTGDQITEICASSYTMEFKTFFVEKVIQCHVSPGQNNVTLTLAGLQANDTGLYICKMERMYPPPYLMNKGNGTHLYVIDPEPCPDTAIYLWVLGATASGFFLYSIIISAILVGKAIKRRRCLTTGVYVKMPSEKLEKKVIPFHITVNCNKEGEKPFPSWDGVSANSFQLKK